MKVLSSFRWGKKMIPSEERVKKRNVARVTSLSCLNPAVWEDHRRHKIALVTGDGSTLIEDVKRFESWGVPHDVFAVNRSLLYFQRPVKHWGAVDAEECSWLAQYCPPENGRFFRHIIGYCKGFDVFWAPLGGFETEFGRRLWIGNSGYFGMLCCVEMGYERIVLAGIPLDRNKHWYDPDGTEGPTWQADTYTIWMDYKIEVPAAERIRALSGYTKFIFGDASKEWAQSVYDADSAALPHLST